MFSKVIGSMNKVVNKVSDVVDDVVDDAKDVITGKKDDKKTSSHGSKDVWERRSDDEGGLFGALKTGVGKIAHGAKEIADGIDDIGDAAIDTGKKAVRQAGKEFKQGVEHAARPFLDTHQRLQEDVQKTIDVLQNTSPSELVDKGWEAIGLSKAEREEIKESFQETYDKVSNAVDDGVQLLADRGEEIVRDTIVDVIRTHSELEDVFDQILPSKEEVEDFIKQQISQTSTEAQELVARLEELGISGAEFGMDLLEQIDGGEIVESAIELAFSQVFDIDLIRTGIAFDAKLLELASEIPSLAQDLIENPEKLESTLMLLRPEVMAKNIGELKPGQSISFQLGLGNAGPLEFGLSTEVQVKRNENNHLVLSLKSSSSGGASRGKGDNKVAAHVLGAMNLEIELLDDRAIPGLLQAIQTFIHDPSQKNLAKLGKDFQLNDFSIARGGDVSAKGVLKAENVAEFTGELKATLNYKEGLTRIGDEQVSYYGASFKDEFMLTAGSASPVKFSLPDSVGGQVSPALDLFNSTVSSSGAKLELFTKFLQQGDDTLQAKVDVNCDMRVLVGEHGIGFQVSSSVLGSIGPNAALLESKITVLDAARLAKELGTSIQDLQRRAESGELDLAQVAKEFSELVPDVIQLSSKLDITVSDKTGAEVSDENIGMIQGNMTTANTISFTDDSSLSELSNLSYEDLESKLLDMHNERLKPKNKTITDYVGLVIRG